MSSYREAILTRLDKSSEPLSGDQLAQELGLSRTGIWKHIQQLRKSGIAIEAHAGLGYSLKSKPFTPALLTARCQGQLIGSQIEILEQTDSTNRDAMRAAEQGADEGLAIFARVQRAGRGRMGRSWQTLPESLACSVLLRPKLPPEQVPQLSLLTAVALHEALSHFATGIAIKWPNDLLFKRHKIAGILTEMRAEPGHTHAVVLGFGINLAAPEDGWPEVITQPATDLKSISGRTIPHLEVAAAVLKSLDSWYARYLDEGFAPVHRAWWLAHAYSGEKVRVHDGESYIEGIAAGLDDDGALLLETKRGCERIIAGDLEI